jgi:hypothetical protein
MTHELVHMAIASLADEHHWLEEGLATYVEPIARAQDGQLPAAKVWESMVSGMAEGEPQRGDHGLDKTHSWGRTYWGGAMFCLVADIEIRRATANREGLQDALRAIVAEGERSILNGRYSECSGWVIKPPAQTCSPTCTTVGRRRLFQSIWTSFGFSWAFK